MTSLYPRIAMGAILALAIGIGISIASLASAETDGPTVVLSSTAASTTSAASIPVSATFSESVTFFESDSITVTNGTVSNFAGSGANYTFNVNPTSQGAVSVTVIADVATSPISGKGNQPSNTLVFTHDTAAAVITEVTGITSPTSDSTPSYTFNATEGGTINLSGGCASATSMAPSGTTTITFNALANGSYDCTLWLTDTAMNASNELEIQFGVDAGVPDISNISVSNISSSGATIHWTTDVAADSQVFYGTSSSYGASTTLDATASTSHSVILTGLSEGTVYHFQVRSANSTGPASSGDNVFVTLSTSSSTPLAVTSTDTVSSQATADNTFEHGWKWIMHLTIPDIEDAFRMKFADFTMTGGSATIPVASNLRIYSSQSSNASSAGSSIMATDNDYGDWLYFTGDAGTTTPGRQVDVTIEMKVPVNTSTGTYSTIFGANSTTTSATSTASE